MDVFATLSAAYILAGIALAIFITWLVVHRRRQERRQRNRPDTPISPPSRNAAAHPVEGRRN